MTNADVVANLEYACHQEASQQEVTPDGMHPETYKVLRTLVAIGERLRDIEGRLGRMEKGVRVIRDRMYRLSRSK